MIAFLAIVLFVQYIVVRYENAARDDDALLEHYKGYEIAIVDSLEWPSYETCFSIVLHGPATEERLKKVVMFSAGNDDLPYSFAGEYRTLEDCKAGFNRG